MPRAGAGVDMYPGQAGLAESRPGVLITVTIDTPVRPLLAVKQAVPPVRAGAVARARLHESLRSAETRLTVVVAPAGWGKTSLLSGWAADPGEHRRIAWVSLDESDDEPVRFWSYVFTALRRADADLSPAPLEALGAAAVPPVEVAVPLLLNELTESQVQHVLVLDDYHVLADPQIHESVEFLLSYLPPGLRLVVAGRADPPLPLARLRARGELTEVRAAQLRFAPAESRDLLSAVSGHDLDDATATAVWTRTEGWAAGLQLAALALRANPAAAGGDDRYLLDYFAAEVVPGLAPAQRELLIRAAPLELLSGSLCDAALAVSGSAGVLAELVRADLFVAALDGEREWYRCHRLLRDALLREPGADRTGVLNRAAGWFAGQGRLDDAVRHLLLAGDQPAAADLLLRNATSWFFARGAAASYLLLGEQLDESAIGPALGLSLAYAGALSGQTSRVGHWLDVCEAGITPDTRIPQWRSARGAVQCLRATFGMSDGDSAESVELAQRAVDLETADGEKGNPIVRPALGAALVRDGRFSDGVAILADLWQHERRDWPSWVVLQTASALLLGLTELGRGDQADRVLRQVGPLADTVERDWGNAAAVLATIRIVQGRRRHQSGDAVAAAGVLRRGVALAELHPRPLVAVFGLVYLADAEIGRGDRAAARAALARARDIADDEPVSPIAVRRLAEAETRLGRGAARAATRSGALFEELTDRELSILRLLPGPASQREIGAALFLSINTVKAYNKSLYRKLAVASRSDAVAVARDLGLI